MTIAPPAPRKSMEPYLKDEVEFYDFQITGIRQLAGMKSFILADQMGLGKSLQALTVFIIDVVRGWASSAIVVCPVTLRSNWADEIIKFTRVKYMILGAAEKKGKTVQLGPKAREAQIAEFATWKGPKILITNYEQIVPHVQQLNKLKFDVAIFDEAHYIKNYKAKRTKACQKLFSRRSFLLTGTPMLNHVHELWVLLNRIDPGYYSSYWSYVQRYCVFGGFQKKQIIGVKNERELHSKLQNVMLRRLKKDVLKLKEPQIIERKVDLSAEQQKLYDEVIVDLRLTNPDGSSQDIENALTKFLRCKQICATTYPFTGVDTSNKLDQVVEDVKELVENDERVVIFSQFRAVLECLEIRLKDVCPVYQIHGDVPKDDRQGVVKAWGSNPSPSALICMLQVAGIGLNMTQGRHVLFVDELFVPGLNQQAIDRLHRIGQDEAQYVQVFKYITRKTIENRIQQILKSKVKLNDSVIEDSNWKRALVKAVLSGEDE